MRSHLQRFRDLEDINDAKISFSELNLPNVGPMEA